MAGLGHYSPCIPGGFTLPHRSDGTLGRGPRSEPRAPMQMVSGALGSLGFRARSSDNPSCLCMRRHTFEKLEEGLAA